MYKSVYIYLKWFRVIIGSSLQKYKKVTHKSDNKQKNEFLLPSCIKLIWFRRKHADDSPSGLVGRQN